MRVLVTVYPLMYRESIALSLRRHRPHFEVMLGDTASLNGAGGLAPHMLLRNDTDGVEPELIRDIPCRVEILYSDGMDARVILGGETWYVPNMSTEDLLAVADRAEKLIPEAG